MIDLFSMAKRVLPRLAKHVFDRVWNEPYSEYRTNTRPRILNGISEAASGMVYQQAAGVLTGAFEQIALPSSNPYYVYSIEREQFRPIKLNATSWISLEKYCNQNLTDLRVYSDDGVFLWRGGIFIKQATLADSILVAVDATMLHRCLDTFQILSNGDRQVIEHGDPSAIFFTKYCDSDEIDDPETQTRHLNKPDNLVNCKQLTSDDVRKAINGGTDPIDKSIYGLAFINGRAVVPGADYLRTLQKGDYIEQVYDEDVVYDTYIDRSADDAPIYLNSENKKRMLFHVPRVKNPESYLITYNTCDFYLIPKVITPEKEKGGFVPANAGVIVHMCDREKQFHQLTFNDLSIDLDLLDEIADKNGFVDYYVHFIIRHHKKKVGLARDLNYCDLLYSYSHDDQMILSHLLQTNDYGMTFWSAAYLEDHGNYSDAMMSRVGPTTPNKDNLGYWRTTIDKFYKGGKDYQRVTIDQDINDPTDTKAVEFIPAERGSPLDEGVVKMTPASHMTPIDTREKDPVDPNKNDGVMEHIAYPGIQVTSNGDSTNQCDHCVLKSICNITKNAQGRRTDALCPYFSNKTIEDYVKIFGYYHTLSLICKRVTTYRVVEDERRRVLLELQGKEVTYNKFPVHVPLALFDLKTTEWYPMVYLNGNKLADEDVTVNPQWVENITDGLEEIHWTYVPRFDEDLFFDEDQRMLEVIVDESVKIKPDDYVTIELIPKPEQEGETRPVVELADCAFDIHETEDTDDQMAFHALGSNLKMYDAEGQQIPVVSKNSELLFLNGKQLVNGVDYMEFKAYGDKGTVLDNPTIQNISYIREKGNLLEAILSEDVVIGTAKGFTIGNKIEWDGVSPFWFDNLSILSVGGSVVNNFVYEYSALYLNDNAHTNGEPYMVRTSVPELILQLIRPSEVDYEAMDMQRMKALAEYFEKVVKHQPYRALIPYEHKVYSTYLLKIIDDYLHDRMDFRIVDDEGKPLSGAAFRAQEVFEQYEPLKEFDVVYTQNHPGLTEDNLRFVDIYPLYHNLMVRDRVVKRKIAYLIEKMLEPSVLRHDDADKIRHREHINDK